MAKFVNLFLAGLVIIVVPVSCSVPTLVPPQRERKGEKISVHSTLGKWLPVSNETYEHAVIVDKFGGVILCRVRFGKELIPGWELYPQPGCLFGHRKKTYMDSDYEHLVVLPDAEHKDIVYVWTKQENGTICESPILGGSSAKGEPYFICRANVEGILLSGKILQQSRASSACLLPVRSQEVKLTKYELLCQIDTSESSDEVEEEEQKRSK